MNIKSILLASATVFAVANGALAADAISYEEPVPAISGPIFTWTGGYVGGQVGYGWGRSKIGSDDATFKVDPDGFLMGIYGGYNYDLGNSIVVGVDADLTHNWMKKSEHFSNQSLSADVESKLRWSGAARARVGVAVDRMLPYVAGGLALGNVKSSATIVKGSDTVIATKSDTQTGWTLGAGIDYAATDNIIVRGEYRYTDYGTNNYGVGDDHFSTKMKTHDLRLGAAYKF
ncbi:outer membrane protein [Daeguia caeni]|uniref:Outer membrane protein n=1 Tax=Daeguia caeni TaxID=439612 RepID=A0ABV9H302_9HYPH